MYRQSARRLQDRNSDFRKLNGNDFSTLYRKLLRSGPVTPEFTTLECVQQLGTTAISKRVCFTTIR